MERGFIIAFAFVDAAPDAEAGITTLVPFPMSERLALIGTKTLSSVETALRENVDSIIVLAALGEDKFFRRVALVADGRLAGTNATAVLARKRKHNLKEIGITSFMVAVDLYWIILYSSCIIFGCGVVCLFVCLFILIRALGRHRHTNKYGQSIQLFVLQ
jgi:hypothetical protein